MPAHSLIIQGSSTAEPPPGNHDRGGALAHRPVRFKVGRAATMYNGLLFRMQKNTQRRAEHPQNIRARLPTSAAHTHTNTPYTNLPPTLQSNVLHGVVGPHGGPVVRAEAIVHEAADDGRLPALSVPDYEHLARYRGQHAGRDRLQRRRRNSTPAAVGAPDRCARSSVGRRGGGGSRDTAHASAWVSAACHVVGGDPNRVVRRSTVEPSIARACWLLLFFSRNWTL